MELVEELKKSNIKGLIEWAKVIQVFCQKYQRIFGVKIQRLSSFCLSNCNSGNVERSQKVSYEEATLCR